MTAFGSKWTGPFYSATGMLLLSAQVYYYVASGLLSAWLIGGGVGLLIAGVAAWFYRLDDSRSGVTPSSVADFPTAEEYDRKLHEVESKVD